MQVLTEAGYAATNRKSPLAFIHRVLGAVLRADARYRQGQRLRRQSDERLRDMGISRKDADAAFHARYGNHAADQAPIKLQNQW